MLSFQAETQSTNSGPTSMNMKTFRLLSSAVFGERFLGCVLLLGTVALAGCSSVPTALRDQPYDNITLHQVNSIQPVPPGVRVRWGGTIVSIENQADQTVLQVLYSNLTRGGRPLESPAGAGRFFLRVPGFLDPLVYKPDREITAIGVLQGSQQQTVGEHTLTLPMVSAISHYLWAESRHSRDPYYAGYPYYWGYPYWGYYGLYINLGHRHGHGHRHGGRFIGGIRFGID
jgi:outer membrane lipoprotein